MSQQINFDQMSHQELGLVRGEIETPDFRHGEEISPLTRQHRVSDSLFLEAIGIPIFSVDNGAIFVTNSLN